MKMKNLFMKTMNRNLIVVSCMALLVLALTLMVILTRDNAVDSDDKSLTVSQSDSNNDSSIEAAHLKGAISSKSKLKVDTSVDKDIQTAAPSQTAGNKFPAQQHKPSAKALASATLVNVDEGKATGLIKKQNTSVSRNGESVDDVLNDPAINWKDPESRAKAVKRMRAAEERNLAKAKKIAEKQGLPMRRVHPDGSVSEIVGVDPSGELVINITNNVNAAISTNANLANSAPYNLDGSGVRVGVWDSGGVRITHEEFASGSRVAVLDGSPSANHATHAVSYTHLTLPTKA